MKPNVQIDFNKIMAYAKDDRSVERLTDEDFEKIYKVGVYYGAFSGENFGEDCRRNSVYGFLETLQGLYKASLEYENQTMDNKEQKDKQMHTFHVSINGGKEQTIMTKTSQYQLAALTALGMLDYEEAKNGENVVKIWVPDLLPHYGPYYYAYDGHQCGQASLEDRF